MRLLGVVASSITNSVLNIPVVAKFFAISKSAGIYAKSTDLTSWTGTSVSNNLSYSWTGGTGLIAGINYAAGKYVVVGSNPSTVYSTNGITWTYNSYNTSLQSYQSPVSLESVPTATKKFFSTTGYSDQAITSTDGITWETVTIPFATFWKPFTLNNKYYAWTTDKGRSFIESTDGITWTGTSFNTLLPTSSTLFSYSPSWTHTVYGNGKYVVRAGSDINNYGVSAYSTDLITWNYTSTPSASIYTRGLAYGNGIFLSTVWKPGAGHTEVSTDGITWTLYTMGQSIEYFRYVVYSSALNKFYIGNPQTATIISTTNGASWSFQNQKFSATDDLIIGEGGYPVSLHNSGYVEKYDGFNWTTFSVPNFGQSNIRRIAYGDGKYLIPLVGKNTYVTSTDLYTWTESTSLSSVMPNYTFQGDDAALYNHLNGTWMVIPAYQDYAYVTPSLTSPNWTKNYIGDSKGAGYGYNDSKSPSVANSKFIVIANSGEYPSALFRYSTDGIIWEGAGYSPSIPTNNAKSFAYGNGKYVIVTDSSWEQTPFYYSTDFATWTTSTAPAIGTTFEKVIYGDKFVAVGYENNSPNNNYSASSTDGMTWTFTSIPTSGIGNSGYSLLAYGAGKYVAVSGPPKQGMGTGGGDSYPNKIAYSTDGISWTASTLPLLGIEWKDFKYINNKFFLVGNSGTLDAYLYSTDAINWSGTSVNNTLGGLGSKWRKIVKGSNEFIVTTEEYNSTKILRSTNGNNWQALNKAIFSQDGMLGFGNGKFFSARFYSDQAEYSTDGITWTIVTVPAIKGWNELAYGDNKYIILADYDSTYIFSTDAITWSTYTLPDAQPFSLIYGLNKFFVTMPYSSAYFYSSDGTTWSTGTFPSSGNGDQHMASGAGKLVVIETQSDQIKYSTNGTSWTQITGPYAGQTIGYNGITPAITFANDRFIMHDNSYSSYYTGIYTSTDAITWTSRTMPIKSSWVSFAFG